MKRFLVGSLAVLMAGRAASAQISLAEYAARRGALASKMNDGVLVAFGSQEPKEDFLSFFQNSPFRYLTGLDEPNATLVLVKRGEQVSATLFVEERDPAAEVWTGHRFGPEGATKVTGIPARQNSHLRSTLDSLLTRGTRLYVVNEMGSSGESLSSEAQYVQKLKSAHPGLEVASAAVLVAQLRGKKSDAELDLIRKAVDITVAAQNEVATIIEPELNEFEAQALIEYTFRRNGAERTSFSSIVGSGPNSTTLHYNADDRFMGDNEVVVVDIGASYRGYAADVTRTYPVNGTFTPDQRLVYQIVRDAQAAAERQARPGARAQLMTDSSTAVLAAGLAKLGLIESPNATYDCTPQGSQQCPQYLLYYMHGLGHGIGLEVHDPEQASYTGVLAAGSAFTIEPGIYVRANVLETLPPTSRNRALIAKLRPAVDRFANIGIRIEDDYLVTSKGLEWISRAPRELAEVEAAMKPTFAGPAPRDRAKVDWYKATERKPQ